MTLGGGGEVQSTIIWHIYKVKRSHSYPLPNQFTISNRGGVQCIGKTWEGSGALVHFVHFLTFYCMVDYNCGKIARAGVVHRVHLFSLLIGQGGVRCIRAFRAFFVILLHG